MARRYPRFIYSNPKNTKNKGPFVVHCLNPQFIVKIYSFDGRFIFHIIDRWENNDAFPPYNFDPYIDAMEKWFLSQIKNKEINLKISDVEKIPVVNPFL